MSQTPAIPSPQQGLAREPLDLEQLEARLTERFGDLATDVHRGELTVTNPPIRGLVVDGQAMRGLLEVQRSAALRLAGHTTSDSRTPRRATSPRAAITVTSRESCPRPLKAPDYDAGINGQRPTSSHAN